MGTYINVICSRRVNVAALRGNQPSGDQKGPTSTWTKGDPVDTVYLDF